MLQCCIFGCIIVLLYYCIIIFSGQVRRRRQSESKNVIYVFKESWNKFYTWDEDVHEQPFRHFSSLATEKGSFFIFIFEKYYVSCLSLGLQHSVVYGTSVVVVLFSWIYNKFWILNIEIMLNFESWPTMRINCGMPTNWHTWILACTNICMPSFGLPNSWWA